MIAFYSHVHSTFDAAEIELLKGLVAEISFALQAIDARSRIAHIATHDPVTNLPLADDLDLEIETLSFDPTASGEIRPAVDLIDVERVELMNDAFGRAAVDNMLREWGQRLGTVVAGDRVRLLRRRAGPFVLIGFDAFGNRRSAQ